MSRILDDLKQLYQTVLHCEERAMCDLAIANAELRVKQDIESMELMLPLPAVRVRYRSGETEFVTPKTITDLINYAIDRQLE